MPPEPYVSLADAATYLGVSPRTLQDWVHDRKVPFHKVGRLTRFRLSELDAWVAEQTSQKIAALMFPARKRGAA